jgi:hypothetical protein
MRYIVLAVALCFALAPASAEAARKPAKHKVTQHKGHKAKRHAVRRAN